MLAFIAFLQLLDCVSALMSIFFVPAAIIELGWANSAPLRGKATTRLTKKLLKADPPEATNPAPKVLWSSTFALHKLIYRTLSPQISAKERAELLRGNRFAALADSIIDGNPLPIVKEMGLRLPSEERMEAIAALPELWLTRPEEKRKRERRVPVVETLLAPPGRKSKGQKERAARRAARASLAAEA
ncbi:hypothetical protein BDW02DRAFT_596108 [Decorospora gaudefroyi]|uniref:Uncharacterized protein n=1 Tax=Decorospora gaudefroyi TaxID=184978 RepID=A0A6A5KLF4_9PLEO|nr:hypothetical protein BDW02DRAFT_596108 [Decorospora gaudefroyi]